MKLSVEVTRRNNWGWPWVMSRFDSTQCDLWQRRITLLVGWATFTVSWLESVPDNYWDSGAWKCDPRDWTWQPFRR